MAYLKLVRLMEIKSVMKISTYPSGEVDSPEMAISSQTLLVGMYLNPVI